MPSRRLAPPVLQHPQVLGHRLGRDVELPGDLAGRQRGPAPRPGCAAAAARPARADHVGAHWRTLRAARHEHSAHGPKYYTVVHVSLSRRACSRGAAEVRPSGARWRAPSGRDLGVDAQRPGPLGDGLVGETEDLLGQVVAQRGGLARGPGESQPWTKMSSAVKPPSSMPEMSPSGVACARVKASPPAAASRDSIPTR